MKRPNLIALEQIFDEPVRFTMELALTLSALDREPLVEITPVRFEGEVARIEAGFSLKGRISYGGRLECSRCLESYPFQEDERFSLVLYKRQPAASEERELEKADLDAYFYEEPELDVAPIVEERIQLAVPMKPLCRPDCRGLCVQCGSELNRQPCGCAARQADPRWEALRILSKKA